MVNPTTGKTTSENKGVLYLLENSRLRPKDYKTTYKELV